MAFARTVRNLAGRLRRQPATSPPAPPPTPLEMDCTAVLDHSVSADYPGAVRRPARLFRWADGSLDESGLLNLFEVPGAILTRIYLPIDPARGHFFLNHSYDHLPLVTEASRIVPGSVERFRFDEIHDIAGKVIVIGGIIADNYYHALLNWFSRFTIVEALAPHLYNDPEVRFLVDIQARKQPFLSMLDAIGVPPERILWCDHRLDYRIEQAVLVSFIHEGLLCPEIFGLLADRIRAVLGVEREQRGTRRIWISREHVPAPRRQIVNIDEIAPMLEAHGFERIALETLSFAEQVALFADAEVVAGSHGAGFSNIIFCPPSCRVLLVENDFTCFLNICNLFLNLARTGGLECEMVRAKTIRRDDVDYSIFINNHFADAVVDPNIFGEALDRAVRPAAARRP